MTPPGAVTLAICRPGSVANSAFQGSCSKPLCATIMSVNYDILRITAFVSSTAEGPLTLKPRARAGCRHVTDVFFPELSATPTADCAHSRQAINPRSRTQILTGSCSRSKTHHRWREFCVLASTVIHLSDKDEILPSVRSPTSRAQCSRRAPFPVRGVPRDCVVRPRLRALDASGSGCCVNQTAGLSAFLGHVARRKRRFL